MLKSSFPVTSFSVVVTTSVVGGILAFLLLLFVLLLLLKSTGSRPSEETFADSALHRYGQGSCNGPSDNFVSQALKFIFITG